MTILETERLILRPLQLSDAPTIQELAGKYEIAATTLNIPYPYPEGAAADYIASLPERTEQRTFGIVRKRDSQLMGGITIVIEARFNQGSLGYWIGVPYWNQGYMSEAARRVIGYGFAELNLHRVYASYFSQNIASRRVMEKAGMTYEGTLREHVERMGKFYDLGYCGILRREWESA